MYFFKAFLFVSFIATSQSFVEKVFSQGPYKNYLMNSSTLFIPTDYLTINSPVSDVRSIDIKTGIIGGLDSLVPTGTVSQVFKDSNDGNFFYQMWHFAHVDNKHSRTNVVTIIISLGDIGASPSGDIEDTNAVRRALDTTSIPKVYVQVYRTWSIPVTLPLTQSNMDGWWHSITHVFHTIENIYNKYKEVVTIARVVYPILVSMSDEKPGLGLKSLTYSPEPQSSSSSSSSTTNDTSSNNVFTYKLTPGEMAAVVIFVFLSGAIVSFGIPKVYYYNRENTNSKLDVHDVESHNTRRILSQAIY